MTDSVRLIRASRVAFVGNLVLAVAKIVVGLAGGSLSVLGDGLDSAMDVVVSVIMMFTARIMSRPPNPKYVYGYEKAEGIATKALSFFIFYAGIQMLLAAAGALLWEGDRAFPSVSAVYVMVVSVVGKLLLARYLYAKGQRLKSQMLQAAAANMRADVAVSGGVLAGLACTFVFHLPLLDAIVGLAVSVYIIRSSVKLFMESSVELMDGVKDPTIYSRIFRAVEEVPGVCNPHRVRSQMVGNLYMIVLDVEADGKITLDEAHELTTRIEAAIRRRVENVYDIVVHVEPKGKRLPKERFGMDPQQLG